MDANPSYTPTTASEVDGEVTGAAGAVDLGFVGRLGARCVPNPKSAANVALDKGCIGGVGALGAASLATDAAAVPETKIVGILGDEIAASLATVGPEAVGIKSAGRALARSRCRIIDAVKARIGLVAPGWAREEDCYRVLEAAHSLKPFPAGMSIPYLVDCAVELGWVERGRGRESCWLRPATPSGTTVPKCPNGTP